MVLVRMQQTAVAISISQGQGVTERVNALTMVHKLIPFFFTVQYSTVQ